MIAERETMNASGGTAQRRLSLAFAVVLASASFAAASPPSFTPLPFHPFGPPTQLIPDGATVPFNPIKPISPHPPLFMMPITPFGHLGQNYGALGGTLEIDQRQALDTPETLDHRRAIPTKRTGQGSPTATTSAASGRSGAGGSSRTTAGSRSTPDYRRPLGW